MVALEGEGRLLNNAHSLGSPRTLDSPTVGFFGGGYSSKARYPRNDMHLQV